MSEPRIVDVRVVPSTEYPGGMSVSAIWSGVDRPDVGGWLAPGHLADALVLAILAGAAYGPATVATDIYGETYAKAERKVTGRYMASDLTALGY